MKLIYLLIARSTRVDLYSLRRRVPHGTSSTSCLHDEYGSESVTDRVGERLVYARVPRQLHRDGQWRLLLHAGRGRPDEDMAADVRAESADHLAHRRGEDVDAADDQHVVGPSRCSAGGGPVRPQAHGLVRRLDMVVGAEPQQRRGAVPQMAEHELAARVVLRSERGSSALGIDQLNVDEAARADVHAILLFALAE